MRTARQSKSAKGFTLVEVILAILIISGIMTVLLYFYQRAAEVRKIALDETEYISISRMVLEQITSELRTARVIEDQFIGMEGSSNSIRFVCTALPITSRWLVDTNQPLLNAPATDLKEVSYSLWAGTNLLGAHGLERSERFHAASTVVPSTNTTSNLDVLGIPISTTNDLLATNMVSNGGQLLTEVIRFIQFRYWDGTEWIDSWSSAELPRGVEVTVGREPMPQETSAEGYPFEFFRRIVFLPNSEHPANKDPLESLVPVEGGFL